MILKKLSIYSLINNEKIKEYDINNIGLSVILGSKKNDVTEANGAGKTTFIECLNTLLGKELPQHFIKSEELNSKDIFLVLMVSIDNNDMFLGRRITDKINGYILNNDNFSIDLSEWNCISNEDYRNKIEEFNYFNLNTGQQYPSYAQVREYISRDEKQGFNSILLGNRNSITNYKIISFLSLFPFNIETDILKYKNNVKELNQKKKLINSISGDIKDLRIEQKKITDEINELQNIIDNSDINKKIDIDREKYSNAKITLNTIQRKIFKLEKIKLQYVKNIDNLEQKIKDIKRLDDIEDFYNNLVQYFPNNLKKNYEQIKEFYNFMLENRGEYFNNKIEQVEKELKKLFKERKYIEQIIKDSSKVLQDNNIIQDINALIEEINTKNLLLAEVNVKINYYEQKKYVEKQINKEKAQIIKKIEKAQLQFEEFEINEENLKNIFDNLLDITYGEKGDLVFEMEQSIDQNKSTGRIKFECSIEDEKSHGRHIMRVNIFDLTLLLNRINEDFVIPYLIHDGSYCKPDDKFSKGRLIQHIDKKLQEMQKGQYIITANIDEFNKEDITWLFENNKVIAKLDREDNSKNRFFGFKY
ncbi:DUF2326 domain-containing protein [Clostridium thermobutyricum]|uniref:DUF2326 domain-containing protein n=1 Tax=Clostridium thermobutyricum TaxID=29372 RepID=UPI0018A9FB1E|nr:DUF2326 domain-containing protein [Clostridium thermobutyricum]